MQLDYDRVMTYVRDSIGPESALEQQIRREAVARDVHPVGREKARALELLVRLRQPRRILEIGGGLGYSALCMARALRPKALIESIELVVENVRLARKFLQEAGVSRLVRFRTGPALTILPRLRGPFDFVFIDANKVEYPAYLEHALRVTRKGAVIVADNVFWQGTLILGTEVRGAQPIRRYMRCVLSDPRLLTAILPLGDGVGVSLRLA